MAKWLHDKVLESGPSVIKTGITGYGPANKQVACSAQPTTYAEANATYALADVAVTGTDFTFADGDVSGRKLTVGAKSAVAIDTGGDYTHLALIDTVNEVLLAVTTGTTQTLTAGGTVDMPAYDIEVRDPA